MASITCANCKNTHTSVAEVRLCHATKAGTVPLKAKVAPAPVKSTYKPKFQPKETFGQTLRRNSEVKAKLVCWACDSTDIEYRVLKGKQLLCCPDHPKTMHPDYVLTPEQVAEKLGGTIEPAPKRQVAAPNPRSKLVNGRRVFREGCEPGKYEGMEHSDDVKRCGRCAGTGLFITGSMNGKPTGPGGPCFRCAGKARQTCCTTEVHAARYEAIMSGDLEDISACCDVVRNDLYDRFAIRISAF